MALVEGNIFGIPRFGWPDYVGDYDYIISVGGQQITVGHIVRGFKNQAISECIPCVAKPIW